MNKDDILYHNTNQKEATERVLAFVRLKTISKEIDELISEIIKHASNIDKTLEENDLTKRYLDRVGNLEDLNLIYLDPDLEDIDFRVKELLEDLIKRINTRINLVKLSDELIKELKDTYELDESLMEEDIKIAKLDLDDFQE